MSEKATGGKVEWVSLPRDAISKHGQAIKDELGKRIKGPGAPLQEALK